MFTIYKNNHHGEELVYYSGEVLERGKDFICVEAIFLLRTRDYGYVTLKRGDVFTEWFYSNRWYNVFKIVDVDSKQLKGYYCNITRPAIIRERDVRADDLALDIFVKPSGKILRLDQEEYDELGLPEEERQQVERAVAEIHRLAKARQVPFHDLPE